MLDLYAWGYFYFQNHVVSITILLLQKIMWCWNRVSYGTNIMFMDIIECPVFIYKTVLFIFQNTTIWRHKLLDLNILWYLVLGRMMSNCLNVMTCSCWLQCTVQRRKDTLWFIDFWILFWWVRKFWSPAFFYSLFWNYFCTLSVPLRYIFNEECS
jgi:hypothetical protein